MSKIILKTAKIQYKSNLYKNLTDMSKLHLPLYKCYPFTYVTRFKFSFKTY